MRGIEQVPWLYDAGMALLEATGLAEWRRELVAGARGRVLDVGCGTGRDLASLPPGTRATGLDPNLPSVLAARRRAPGAALVVGTAEALPFREESFDTVLSGLCFCSVPDPDRGLREVRRVLSRSGSLRMLEHVRSTHPVAAFLQDVSTPVWKWATGGCHPNRRTEEAVVSAGFRVETRRRRAHRSMRLFSARPAAGRRASP